MRVIITTSSFAVFDDSPLKSLEAQGIAYELNAYGRKLTAEEVVEMARDADGILAGTEPLDRFVLEQLPHLKVISRCGVGMDNVDLAYAESAGVKVYNTPDGPTQAVAELTVGLMIDLLRKVSAMDRQLRAGVWKKQMGNLLQGKKVAIVGFGRIGKQVARLLEAFDADIAYCDTCRIESPVCCMDKAALLGWGDIVTLHCSSNTEGGPVMGEREIRSMKPGAWLVNASRGGLVDETALQSALKEGRLAGAAIDVFEKEPYTGPLRDLDNVILTPHVGSYAREGRIRMEALAAANLIEGLVMEQQR